MFCYAGIGSRRTPAEILDLMEQIAYWLADEDGMVLRSGHAPGADQAFESGAEAAGGDTEIFLPWKGFEGNVELPRGCAVLTDPTADAYGIAAALHPVWERLGRGARALMARNCHQVLGASLDDPARFVLCWTPRAAVTGGTGQALRLAEQYDVPIYNLALNAVEKTCREWVL